MSLFMCHVSHVTRHMLRVMFFLNFFFIFGQSGGASRWRVCYQQGLPRLVKKKNCIEISLHLVVLDNQIQLLFDVPDDQIVLHFSVLRNQISINFGVPDKC